MRQEVIYELIKTEQSYGRDLQVIVNVNIYIIIITIIIIIIIIIFNKL